MTDLLTQLIQSSRGNRDALAAVFEAVYSELRQLAQHALASEYPGQTLQPTALVHEVYVRLTGNNGELDFDSRSHFFSTAANAMRQILIEAARRKATLKRGGDVRRKEIDLDNVQSPEQDEELIALDEALDKLTEKEPLIAEVVKLRYFAGLTIRETAEVLRLAPRTVDGYWAYAKSWLTIELRKPNQ